MRSLTRSARRGAVALAVALAALTFTTAVPAVAASPHHAVVVTEANGTVTTRVVTFSGDSISGLDALRDAGASPVIFGFPGIGGAVCAMHVPPGGPVVGCPADNSCLTCSPSSYWAYFRAPAGTHGFTWSRAGASSTRVHDGDVEGWRWGSGDAPPYPSVTVVTTPPPSAAPSAAPPSAAPAGSAGTAPTSAAPGATGAAGASGSTGAGAATTSTPAAPGAAPVTTGSRATGTTRAGARADGSQAASHRADSHGGSGGGGSAVGFVAFGAIALALAVAIVLARRLRRT